jgi:hypothetical protein
MFIDDETTKFKLKFVGREDITTKFGVVSWSLSRWCNQGVFLRARESNSLDFR